MVDSIHLKTAVNQEKLWAEYLFKDGSMIGLNDKLLTAVCGMDCQS